MSIFFFLDLKDVIMLQFPMIDLILTGKIVIMSKPLATTVSFSVSGFWEPYAEIYKAGIWKRTHIAPKSMSSVHAFRKVSSAQIELHQAFDCTVKRLEWNLDLLSDDMRAK